MEHHRNGGHQVWSPVSVWAEGLVGGEVSEAGGEVGGVVGEVGGAGGGRRAGRGG